MTRGTGRQSEDDAEPGGEVTPMFGSLGRQSEQPPNGPGAEASNTHAAQPVVLQHVAEHTASDVDGSLRKSPPGRSTAGFGKFGKPFDFKKFIEDNELRLVSSNFMLVNGTGRHRRGRRLMSYNSLE